MNAITVRGVFQGGVARPDQPVEGLEGRRVLITVLEEDADAIDPGYDPATDPLLKLIADCRVKTDKGDLARQLDHYL